MRHGKKFNHLSRKTGHRRAMLSNMSSSLIKHKRITTTVAKAKALRVFVEPLLTKSKNDTVHSRRTVFSYLQDKLATKELFDEVSGKIADRPGGYTRILKTGFRLGDGAEMCMIELVDYNQDYSTVKEEKATTRKRRTRRGGKSAEQTTAAPATEKAVKEKDEAKTEEPKAEETQVEETIAAQETQAEVQTEEPKVEEVAAEEKAEVKEEKQEPKAEAKEAEEKSEDTAEEKKEDDEEKK